MCLLFAFIQCVYSVCVIVFNRDVNTVCGDDFDSRPVHVIMRIFARVTVGLKDSVHEHLIYIFF